MSREADEKLTGGKKPRKPATKPNVGGNFFSFHPTEAEKAAIKAMDLSGEGVLEFIGDLAQRGLQVTFTQNRAENAFCALIRERGKDFDTVVTLACFHANMHVLALQAVYLLTVKYPYWPYEGSLTSQGEFDW